MKNTFHAPLIRFSVFGQPVRARYQTAKLPGGHIKHYPAKDMSDWKNLVKMQAIAHKPDFLWEGAVGAVLTFYLLKPKSTPKKVTAPITRPDLEQYEKPVLDALTGVFYRDDAQVVFKQTSKAYCTTTQPRVEIGLWREQEEINVHER